MHFYYFLECGSIPKQSELQCCEALDYLLELDEEDLGQLEGGNDDDSSTDSEYNDDNLVSIASNDSIPGVD